MSAETFPPPRSKVERRKAAARRGPAADRVELDRLLAAIETGDEAALRRLRPRDWQRLDRALRRMRG